MPEQLVWVLKSRKFWASLIGLAAVIIAALGLPELPEDKLIDAIVTIITVYVGSIAVEDGLSRR